MLDYAQWMNRAIAFAEALRDFPGVAKVEIEVAPPLSDTEIEELGRNCRLPIPDSLQRFWRQASGHCNAKYWLDTTDNFREQMKVAFPHWSGSHIWGGPTFESAREIVSLADSFVDWADSFRDDFPKDARIWEHSLPLIPVTNGDYVGLYLRDGVTNPPVVYLCHDGYGGSGVIDVDLDEFLAHWELLDYLGIHFLTTFLRSDTELLDPTAFPIQAEAARAILRGELRPDLVSPPLAMTESDWTDSKSPETLLEWLEKDGEADLRKVRLLACACCRRVWDLLGDTSRNAIDVTERFADGLASEDELANARVGLSGGKLDIASDELMRAALMSNLEGLAMLSSNPFQAFEESPLKEAAEHFGDSLADAAEFSKSQGIMHSAAYSAIDGTTFATWQITNHLDEPELSAERAAQADLIRHIFGNPFRPTKTKRIVDPNIRQLAENIYEGQPLAAELKAALLGAGYDDLAAHFDRPDHPKGCWALDAMLG